MMKRPNYRDPCTLNFNKVCDNINSAIDNHIQDLSRKTKLPAESFYKWKLKVLNKVKMKIKPLKSNMKPNQFYVMIKLKPTWNPYTEDLLLLQLKNLLISLL